MTDGKGDRRCLRVLCVEQEVELRRRLELREVARIVGFRVFCVRGEVVLDAKRFVDASSVRSGARETDPIGRLRSGRREFFVLSVRFWVPVVS